MGPTTTTWPVPPSAWSRRMPCSAPSACSTATWWSRSRRADCTATASRSCAHPRQAPASGYGDRVDELGGPSGEALLEPTRLYTQPLCGCIDELPDAVHALSHVTGGGIAANLARVLPHGSWVELDRSTWSPQPVFRVLARAGAA